MIPIAEPSIGTAEQDAVQRILRDGQLADGPEVRAFEREFAAYCDTDHAIATCNGTAALHAAIHAAGLGEDDRVVTSPFSFIASANAPRLAGCDVGFVDIDPETYLVDIDQLQARLESGERIDGVIAVHLFGLPVQMDRLMDLATAYDFVVIEDAAQAHGATVDGHPVGGLGDVACFSFYPTKNMTTGEGGMVTTDDPAIAESVRSFIDHGRASGYRHDALGHNFRMTSLSAAIGRVQLDRLPERVARRRRHAGRLTELLEASTVRTPIVPEGRSHAFNQYTIRHPHRDRVQEHLEETGVDSAVYYPIPIHEQQVYDDVEASMPVAESIASEVLSLPVHPSVTEADIDHIGSVVTDTLEVVR